VSDLVTRSLSYGDEQRSIAIEVAGNDLVTVVYIRGDVDIQTIDLMTDLAAQAIGLQPNRVVLDLAGVTFFSAAGIAALHRIRDDTGSAGIKFQLRNLSRPVRRLLEICELVAAFDVIYQPVDRLSGD
jgi:anti-anti-sigma factor